MRTASALALLSAILVACSSDTLTGPSQDDIQPSLSANGSQGRKARPITAECQTTFNAPSFPPPPIHRQFDIGACRFSPLGKMTVSGVQDINAAAGTQAGERTFTARNGDVLRAVHAGTSGPVAPGVIGFSATITFVGGTGRFAGATGEAHVTGTATIATRTAVFEMEGWLRYGRKHR